MESFFLLVIIIVFYIIIGALFVVAINRIKPDFFIREVDEDDIDIFVVLWPIFLLGIPLFLLLKKIKERVFHR